MLTRRDIFRAGVATSALLAVRPTLLAAETTISPVFVVLSGIDEAVPLQRLGEIVRAFKARSVAVAVGLRGLAQSSDRASAAMPHTSLLRTLRDATPNLVEIAVEADGMATQSAYSQLRQASEFQGYFTRALNTTGDYHRQELLMAHTMLAGGGGDRSIDYSAVRPSGIRFVIAAPTGGKTSNQKAAGLRMSRNGVAHVDAESAIFVQAASDGSGRRSLLTLLAECDTAFATARPVVVTLPVAALANLSDSEAISFCSGIAEHISARAQQGRHQSTLPSRFYQTIEGGPRRFVVIRIDDGRINLLHEAEHRDFVRTLLAMGVSVSEGAIPIGYGPEDFTSLVDDKASHDQYVQLLQNSNYELVLHGYRHTQNELLGLGHDRALATLEQAFEIVATLGADTVETLTPPNNQYDTDILAAASAVGLTTFSADHGNYRWISGLDRFGLLHLSNTLNIERGWSLDEPTWTAPEIIRFLGQSNDAVLMIHPNLLRNAAAKSNFMELLASLQKMPGTALVNFSMFRKATMPKLSRRDELLASRRRRHAVTAKTKEALLADEDHDQLKASARLAWRYLEREAPRFGNLAPGTAWLENGKIDVYPFITMWDLGSLLMSNMSAHMIGLIDDNAFKASTAAAIELINKSRWRHLGKVLPSRVVNISDSKDRQAGYDVLDTGRLLVCLKTVDVYTEGSFDIKTLAQSFDIEAALVKGEMHDLSPSSSENSHYNIYSKYASRGFEDWNIAIKPVYSVAHPLADMDASVDFLEEVSARGPIATEPTVTEDIELGFSDHSRLIADTLFAAQVRRHQETGRLTCTSEVPIDAEPWFTYQGYQIDDAGGRWVVHSARPGAQFTTQSFADRNRIVSSKAAFLWAASRPDAYSFKLRDYVTQTARIADLGFAGGILESTGLPTAHSDLNTNAIILETIAYILGGRRPLRQLAQMRSKSNF